jgi:hypothetical protein
MPAIFADVGDTNTGFIALVVVETCPDRGAVLEPR